MKTFNVTIDNAKNATFFLHLMKTLKFVKRVTIADFNEDGSDRNNLIDPSHPATDDEIEHMLNEAEESPLLTVEESKKHAYKLIDKWDKGSK